MRLIGNLASEKEAFSLHHFLLKQGIENTYEPFADPASKEKHYRLWIYEEDDIPLAEEWLARFQQDPNDPQFELPAKPLPAAPAAPPLAPQQEKPKPELKVPLPVKSTQMKLTLTNILMAVCIFLFVWNSIETVAMVKKWGSAAAQLTVTPLQQKLIFDDPGSFEAIDRFLDNYPLKSLDEINELPPEGKALFDEAEKFPFWRGFYELILHWPEGGWKELQIPPLFVKIREGEVYRLISPVILHHDFLHILFNMAWLWVLGRQVEERVRKWKIVLLMLIIGIISNVAQYLMSGPYFLGFSGIVVGLAGFIWARQRTAPWEGYPLQRGTLLFILMFVLAMFALELMTFTLQFLHVIDFTANIANTAHLVGGLVGYYLGKMHFFARSAK